MATPLESNVRFHLNTATASTMPIDTMPQRIAYARACAGLSCTAMARVLGVHKDYYKYVEQKCDRIGIDHLLSIARITDTDPEWLIYGNNHLPRLILLSAPTIGQRLREFRKRDGITCKALAQTAFGVNKLSSVSKWETDRMIPELRTLMLIADAYKISVMSFIPYQNGDLA